MKKAVFNILFTTISVLFLSSNSKIFSQGYNTYSTDNYAYSLSIYQDDAIIEKNRDGFVLYIRQKGQTKGIELFINTQSDKMSALYRDNSYSKESAIRMSNTINHPELGNAFYTFIPNYVYLDESNNGNAFQITDNMSITLQAYIENNNEKIAYQYDKIILKTKIDITTQPYLTLESIERDGALYIFNLSYSGGDRGDYAFYVREGATSRQYKLIPTIFGESQNDNMAIILANTYKTDLGKVLKVKAYFKELPTDRYLAFNVFNKEGETKSLPVDYIIPGSKIIVAPEPPPLPPVEESRPAQLRPITEAEQEDNDNNQVVIITEEVIVENDVNNEVIIPTIINNVVSVETNTEEADDEDNNLVLSSINEENSSILIVEEEERDEASIILLEEDEPIIIEDIVDVDPIIIIEEDIPTPKANNEYSYDNDTVSTFNNMNRTLDMKLNYIYSPNDLTSKITSSILENTTSSIDIVIVLDTTHSMNESIMDIKEHINSLTQSVFMKYETARIGFVLFRDENEKYVTKKIDFSNDPSAIAREVKYFSAFGGGDKSEPIYEALNEAITQFDYNAQTKMILLITDAPGKVTGNATLESTEKLMKNIGIKMETMILPKKDKQDFYN